MKDYSVIYFYTCLRLWFREDVMPEAPRFRELTSPEALGFREFVMVEAGSQLVQYPNRTLAIGKKGNRSVRKISVPAPWGVFYARHKRAHVH